MKTIPYINYYPESRPDKLSKLFTTLYNKTATAIVFLLIFTSFFSPCFSQGHPATDDEFVGPFASLINVKTQFGAIGDGVTDETAALQAALNTIGNNNSISTVVYLPAVLIVSPAR